MLASMSPQNKVLAVAVPLIVIGVMIPRDASVLVGLGLGGLIFWVLPSVLDRVEQFQADHEDAIDRRVLDEMAFLGLQGPLLVSGLVLISSGLWLHADWLVAVGVAGLGAGFVGVYRQLETVDQRRKDLQEALYESYFISVTDEVVSFDHRLKIASRVSSLAHESPLSITFDGGGRAYGEKVLKGALRSEEALQAIDDVAGYSDQNWIWFHRWIYSFEFGRRRSTERKLLEFKKMLKKTN